MRGTLVTPAGDELARLADVLREGLSSVANDLVQLESDASLAIVLDEPVTGRTAELLGDAPALAASLWERFPVVVGAMDRVETALGAGDRRTVRSLLEVDGVLFPDGTRLLLSQAVATLRADLDRVLGRARQVAEVRRRALAQLAAATTALQRAEDTAASVGLPVEPSLVAARELVGRLRVEAATDPLSVQVEAASQAATRAEQRVVELAERRRTLTARLEVGTQLVDHILALIEQGSALLDEARAKIVDPVGLLEPLDPSAPDAGRHGLTSWLTRLDEVAARGEWLVASEGLDSWERVAGGWQQTAQAVVDANGAPLRRRAELRGLLDAFSSKAAAMGRTEDAAAFAAFDAAHAALYEAPCDLERAATLVDHYGAVLAADPQAGEER